VSDDEELRRRAQVWVERTTSEQGVPLKLSDPVAVARVADLSVGVNERRN
jgi:hypothetical protein